MNSPRSEGNAGPPEEPSADAEARAIPENTAPSTEPTDGTPDARGTRKTINWRKIAKLIASWTLRTVIAYLTAKYWGSDH